MSTTDTTCDCTRCTCTEPADLTLGGVPLCGCCAADCPDVHGEEAEERRVQLWRERPEGQARPLSEFAAELGLDPADYE